MQGIRLYQRHDQAFNAQYANIEQASAAQERVLVGAPGTIIEHKRGDAVYYARQFMNAEGKRQQESLGGPKGDPVADEYVTTVQGQIEETKDLIGRIRELAKLGFQIADNKTYATMAVLYNHGLFQAGGVLVGSHAYAVLLNSLGIKALAYETEDIDIARARQLALRGVPSGGLLEILKETGIDFVPVPGFNRGDPPTSFKQAGRTRFHVDLLVPSKDNTFPTVAVPELGAHASGMPYLAYLLGQSHMGTLLSRHGAVPVRVPDPARFAIHKILVSRLRTNMLVKSQKDIEQACVLLAMLGEHRSGDIELACTDFPRSARTMIRRALPDVRRALEAHDGALAELEEGLGG
ncbi:GSU2403 family nucleotidyltransferase fold protein [Paraburkholderia flagellata]|uniref:GSU2403 family nucleotidyltransferase fold protein n=1 Tax=Paraburkholderia flagellata TaxID=2883241 RepID=UPI001F48078A|nr:GSU2403 family nucleotidyltransferase fold protein [Paraburkholderia flagellata]